MPLHESSEAECVNLLLMLEEVHTEGSSLRLLDRGSILTLKTPISRELLAYGRSIDYQILELLCRKWFD